MFLGGERRRVGAAVALAVLLAVVLASPAGAAGWGEERSWFGGLYQQALGWLGFAPSLDLALKDGARASIDSRRRGPHTNLNGAGTASLTGIKTKDAGSSIDPNGHS